MDEFRVHEVADEHPHDADGQVEFRGQLGDRLRGAAAQAHDVHVLGESVGSVSGSPAAGSVTTTAIRSRRCWAVLVVRPRVMAYGRTTGPASSSNQWLLT